jgi:hypothetical protein
MSKNSTENPPVDIYSLRDYFAGQALAGLIVATANEHSAAALAHDAYYIADAMLKARSPSQETEE